MFNIYLVRLISITRDDLSVGACLKAGVVALLILAMSCVIAMVPLLKTFEDFFVNGIHYPGNPLFVGCVD